MWSKSWFVTTPTCHMRMLTTSRSYALVCAGRLERERKTNPSNNMFHLHSCFTILVIISRFICYLSLRSDSVDESSGFNLCECPSFCLCTAEEIDCSAQQLVKIPTEIKTCDWPTVLTLWVNILLYIVLLYSFIFSRNLNDNFIRSINASNFNGFPSLTSL